MKNELRTVFWRDIALSQDEYQVLEESITCNERRKSQDMPLRQLGGIQRIHIAVMANRIPLSEEVRDSYLADGYFFRYLFQKNGNTHRLHFSEPEHFGTELPATYRSLPSHPVHLLLNSDDQVILRPGELREVRDYKSIYRIEPNHDALSIPEWLFLFEPASFAKLRSAYHTSRRG